MKYVIWGAGQRGRKALEILGKDKVLFFVDKNENLMGQQINGVPIKNIDSIRENQSSFLILITPLEYEMQIEDYLKSIGIYHYLLFSDHPFGIDLSEEAEKLPSILEFQKIAGKVAIYGISWFNIYLYDYFKSVGTKVCIFDNGHERQEILKIVSDAYDIIGDANELNDFDYVLASEESDGVPMNKYIDIEDYVERMHKISNPEMTKYQNIHKGQRCFIIATGPSLKVSDLEKLRENGDICISMNRIYNLFDKTDWRPDYYVIEDQKMIEDLAEEIAELKIKHKFVNSIPKQYWNLEKASTSIMYKMIMQNCLTDRIGFSRNLDRLVYNGYTVTYVCLQLAVYMGFSEIYLVGVDFSYSSDVYAETNHFEGYQKYYKDIRLNPIMPERMIRAYKKARKVTESMGVTIYNATRGGKLEVFKRADLDNVLEERK